MRDTIRDIFLAGVRAADPGRAVSNGLDGVDRPARILAIGKAAGGMARAACRAFPGTPTLVITNPENAADLHDLDCVVGDHPVPTARSAQAGEAALSFVADLGAEDHVLALISGGGSALCVALVAGVSLAQKAEVTAALLGAGLDIVQMNTVRQALSRIKGGGLARAAYPARVTTLVLSDVVGDDPRAVASGPTAAPLGTVGAARAILQRAGLWSALPGAVQTVLSRPDEPFESAGGEIRMVGANRLSVAAMAQAAPDAITVDKALVGDVAQAAAQVIARAQTGPGLWVMGGETTVTLRGTGRGGRNQELALRVARGLRDLGRPFVFLSGGTDGRDGPTDAAGGLVDNGTWDRVGPEAEALLANNDSYEALSRARDLLQIPATGTNVADLQVLWVGQRASLGGASG